MALPALSSRPLQQLVTKEGFLSSPTLFRPAARNGPWTTFASQAHHPQLMDSASFPFQFLITSRDLFSFISLQRGLETWV